MNRVCGTWQQLDERLRERGVTRAEVRPAVLSDDGERVCVDVDHPAYPKAPPRTAAVPIASTLVARLRAACGGCDYAGAMMVGEKAHTPEGIRVVGLSIHCRAAGDCNCGRNRISVQHACPLGKWDARSCGDRHG